MTTCIDIDNLLKGASYTALNESYIIFICTFDPFEKGLSHYTFKTRCLQDSEVDIKDGAIKEIFNAKAYATEEDVEISAFLKYIDSKEATDDFTDKINYIVEQAKINEKFKGDYLAMNIRETDIYEEGIAQGAEQAKIETARNFLNMNLSLEQVVQGTGLSLETVEKLANEQKSQTQRKIQG